MGLCLCNYSSGVTMATTEELLNAYLVQPGDIPNEAYYPDQIPMLDGAVTPLVDAWNYFSQLYAVIDSLGQGTAAENANEGIYIASWAFDPLIRLNGPGTLTLVEKLAEKAVAGVDVRVMVWVNDFLMEPSFPLAQIVDIGAKFKQERPHEKQQTINLYGVDKVMRAYEVAGAFPLRDRTVVNTLDNPVGGCHMKFALVFGRDWSVGYTGGIDPMPSRFSDDRHVVLPLNQRPTDDISGNEVINQWHDVQAKVEGPITDEFFKHYRDIWNEVISRRDAGLKPRFRYSATTLDGVKVSSNNLVAVLPESTTIPLDKSIVSTAGFSGHWIQSLRTIPDTRFLLWKERDISFAEDNVFEIELALRKAIGAAKKYIYIEDQAMLSREIFGLLRDAVTKVPENGGANELKVILVTGVADPADPPRDSLSMLYLTLLAGLSDEQRDRIVYYHHNQAVVHSKVFIVDDVVAIIGSAGMFNRALYTEWEHAIAFIDSAGAAVAQLREQLWGEVFCRPPGSRNIGTLDDALAMWKPGWGSGSPADRLPRDAQKLSELWAGTWTFDGPHLTVANAPVVVGGNPGQYPSLTEFFVVAERDPSNNEHLVLDLALDAATPSNTVLVHIFVTADRQRRGLHFVNPQSSVLVENSVIPAATGIEVIDEQTLQAEWIPKPDMALEVASTGVRNNLVGGFIVCTGGPNANEIRRIRSQSEGFIGFDPFPHTVDNSFTYRFALAVVERIDLPESVGLFSGWMEYWWQFLIADIGGSDFFSGRRALDRVELSASVGHKGVNATADVLAVQMRLAQLGMYWVRLDGDMGEITKNAIRLFQAMKNGDEVVSDANQDGRVDVNGDTIRWMNAANAPRWGLMPTGGQALGFTNRDILAQPDDRYDWGSSWMGEVISAAGLDYLKSWINSPDGNANSDLLTINDVSLPQGDNNTDHAGHEAGMQADITLPSKDNTVGSTIANTANFDRDAMRAMLVALHNTGRIDAAYLNDPTLISEGLCTAHPDHDNHLHIALSPPPREESTAPAVPDPFSVIVDLGPPGGDHGLSPAGDRLLTVGIEIGNEDSTGSASETHIAVYGSAGLIYEEIDNSTMVAAGIINTWTWDGRNRGGIVDLDSLANATVGVRVAVTKNNKVVVKTIDVAFERIQPWVSAKVNHTTRKVAIDVFVNCQNESSLSASQFNNLEALALDGISHYWSRSITLNSIPYSVTTTAHQRQVDAENLDLYIHNESEYRRSHNSGIIDASVFYNAGYAAARAAAIDAAAVATGATPSTPAVLAAMAANIGDDDFKDTVAHEFGHKVLEVAEDRDFSWGHKGSVNSSLLEIWNFQDPSPAAVKHPLTGEIDLMLYYKDSEPSDYYTRLIAAELDALRLLQLSKLRAELIAMS